MGNDRKTESERSNASPSKREWDLELVNRKCIQSMDLLKDGCQTADGEDAPTPVWLKPMVQDPGLVSGLNFCGYTLIEELGRGGMGTVFLAAKTGDPACKVAIKFLGILVHHEEYRQRFELEQQSLERMTHPNIARLLDRGVTPHGQPFFVMEYLQGKPLDVYCDEERLPLYKRMDLFEKVCRAVGHAHRKGILHRDLKPSNILVVEEDGEPEPKVIDFGIARIIEGDSALTCTGRHMGTFRYMSPEQAGATDKKGALLALDERVDVYSLGVILQELLIGVPPLAWADGTPWTKVFTDICTKPIRPPSEVWERLPLAQRKSLAEVRGQKVSHIPVALQGGLDWIVQKALHRNPDKRYRTPLRFAGDLRNHFRHRPTEAGQTKIGYFLAKHFLRYPLQITGIATLVFLSLVFGAFFGLRYEGRQQDRDTAAQVTQLLTQLFTMADPDHANLFHLKAGDQVSVKELLDRGVASVRDSLGDQPEIQAELFEALGMTYGNLSMFDAAIPLLKDAIALRASDSGTDQPGYLKALVKLANLYLAKGELSLAEAKLRHALDLQNLHRASDWGAKVSIQNELAQVLIGMGRFDDAESYLNDSLRLLEGKGRATGLIRADTLAKQGVWFKEMGAYQEAERHLQDALTLLQASDAGHRAKAMEIKAQLAVVYDLGGEYEKAESYYRQTIAWQKDTLGPDHPETARSMASLAVMLRATGRFDEAEALHREALERMRRVLGEEHVQTAYHYSNLAALLAANGEVEASLSMHRRAIAIREKVLGPNHPDVANSYNNLGALLFRMDREDEAQTAYCKALEITTDSLGPYHPNTAMCAHNLAVLSSQLDLPEAGALYEQVLAVRRAILPMTHPDLGVSLISLGNYYTKSGEPARGEPLLREGLAVFANALPPDHLYFLQTQSWLGKSLMRQAKYSEARVWLEASWEGFAETLGEDAGRTQRVASHLERLATLEGQKNAALTCPSLGRR